MDKANKFSWGSRIFLLYTGFVALILFLVVKSSLQKIDLVSSDYYKQEIEFQSRYEEESRANNLSQNLSWMVTSQNIEFTFPEGMKDLKGEIYFMKPNNKEQDLRVPVSVDIRNVQSINTTDLDPGVYRLQVQWQGNGQKYFKQGVIVVN
jgi:hypothetical protein